MAFAKFKMIFQEQYYLKKHWNKFLVYNFNICHFNTFKANILIRHGRAKLTLQILCKIWSSFLQPQFNLLKGPLGIWNISSLFIQIFACNYSEDDQFCQWWSQFFHTRYKMHYLQEWPHNVDSLLSISLMDERITVEWYKQPGVDWEGRTCLKLIFKLEFAQ